MFASADRGRASAALLLGWLTACCTASPGPPPRPAPKIDAVVPVRDAPIRQVDAGHLGFPDVARLAGGALLLVYREGRSHVDVEGRLVAQLGTADGVRWSAPYVAIDTPGVDDRDPSLLVLPDGAVLLTWFQYVTYDEADGRTSRHQVFAARSIDGGRTFGAPVQVTPGALTVGRREAGSWVDDRGEPVVVAACSSPALARDETILLPVYYGRPFDPKAPPPTPRSRIGLAVSVDGGATWRSWPVAPEQAPERWLQEPTLLALGGAELLLHARTASGATPFLAGPLVASSSSDGGRTWSGWTPFSLVGHAPYLARLRSGWLVSAFREVSAAGDRVWTSLLVSTDGGQRWSGPRRLHDGGQTDSGYPSLVELAPGRLLVVYYARDGRAILRAEVDVAALAQGAR